MITVYAEVAFKPIPYSLEINVTEAEWNAFPEELRNEIITESIGDSAMRHVEVDCIKVDNVKEI